MRKHIHSIHRYESIPIPFVLLIRKLDAHYSNIDKHTMVDAAGVARC